MIVLYAWEEGGKYYLSRFKRVPGKPKNEYATQPEVVVAANERSHFENPVKVEWLQQ